MTGKPNYIGGGGNMTMTSWGRRGSDDDIILLK